MNYKKERDYVATIKEIYPKILKVFYDLFREDPNAQHITEIFFKKVNETEPINAEDFGAAINYMEEKGMIRLTRFIGGNWIGNIKAYGIEIIEE